MRTKKVNNGIVIVGFYKSTCAQLGLSRHNEVVVLL
jgi:hypothetical protein